MIDEHGDKAVNITGISAGSATVTVTTSDGKTITKEIQVQDINPTAVTICKENKKVRAGDTFQLTAVFDPENTSDQSVTWKSNDTGVIGISADGTCEAKAVGTAEIQATHKTGVTGTISVEVLPVEVSDINLIVEDRGGRDFCKGNTLKITAEVLPENATDKKLTWSSSDENIASVSDQGVVTAKAPGTVQITAWASNKTYQTVHITVDTAPQSFYVTYSLSCSDYNSVGNEWSYGASVNSAQCYSGSTVTLMPGENFQWHLEVVESDKSSSDYGYAGETVTLSNDICTKGYTESGDIAVKEDDGRYSGNVALWTYTFTLKPIN